MIIIILSTETAHCSDHFVIIAKNAAAAHAPSAEMRAIMNPLLDPTIVKIKMLKINYDIV